MLIITTQYTKVTDGHRTDGQRPHDSIGRAYAGIVRQSFTSFYVQPQG